MSKNEEIRIGFVEKVSYGIGDTASNLFFQTFMIFLLNFYTDVFGITARAAGTMLLVTRIWDTVVDPLIGLWSDRTKTRWGKFRPFLLWFAVPYGVAGILTFSTPELAGTGKLIWAYVTYLTMMTVYSCINVPYGALMGVISPNSQDRTALSSFRFVGAFTGGLIVQKFTQPMVDYFGRHFGSHISTVADTARGFQLAMVVFSILSTAMFLLSFAFTRERVEPPKAQKTSLSRDAQDLLTNTPWMVLLLVALFFIGYVAIRNGSIIYYFKYYVHNPKAANNYLVAGTVANITGTLITPYISKYIGKKRLFLILMGLTTALTYISYFAGPQDFVLMYATQISINFFMGPTAPLTWSMYADTADYSEWKHGRRATGFVFAAASFSQKFGWAIGGFVAATLLSHYGYQANAVQSERTLQGIRFIETLAPAICGTVCTLAMTFYGLSDKLVKQIETELKERRQTEAVG